MTLARLYFVWTAVVTEPCPTVLVLVVVPVAAWSILPWSMRPPDQSEASKLGRGSLLSDRPLPRISGGCLSASVPLMSSRGSRCRPTVFAAG